MNKKCIVVYVDDNENGLEEFSWLYKSWVLCGLDSEYDIIAYSNPSIIIHIPIHDNLIIKPMEPIYKVDSFWKDYKFVNSFGMFNDQSECDWIASKYDYILKTDSDVFLTKNMMGLKPDRVMIGMGGYMQNFEEVSSNLSRISKKIGFRDAGLNHVGASIFGKSEIVIPLVKEHFILTKYILLTEFKDNKGVWPGWSKGVSSMYAIHLAVNNKLSFMNTNLYSLDSLCRDNIIDMNTYHIHAWHGGDFSKHKWFRGEYKKLESKTMPEVAKDYCLWVASNDLKDLI